MGKSITSHTSFWSLKATESMLFLLALAFFIACGDDSSNNSNGAEGGMESCTVVKSADSTSYTLKCPDGTQVEIRDGKNGTAGKNGVSDTSASKGAGCTVKELDGGSVSLECPDGTKLVFGEDGKVAGKGGSSSGTSLSSNSKVGSSSSAKPSGNSSSSQMVTGKTQGYVQFNRDRYETISEVAGAGIYLFDADNMAETAIVKVYADSPDTLSITLDRYDRYFYGNLPLSVYGEGFDKGLFVGDTSRNLFVEYRDMSTGVAKYDSAYVNVSNDTTFTRPKISISLGKSWYYDLEDKAVITLRDSRLTSGASVTVYVSSNVDGGREISLYPVEGGAGTWSSSGKGCGDGKTCTPTFPVRGVCPQGWHLPSKTEWETLILAVDDSITEYNHTNNAGIKLKSSSGWGEWRNYLTGHSENANGTDNYGFGALPAGFPGEIEVAKDRTVFWSSTEEDSESSYGVFLTAEYASASATLGAHSKSDNEFSVRCLKD